MSADCSYCTQKRPRLHRDHLHDGEPHTDCRASEDHVHLHADGKRPYQDRRSEKQRARLQR